MTFELDDHWVWDFWFADDGDTFHLFYLHAPKSLGDPQQRHRNARIGHATSEDLRTWTDLGPVLSPGEPSAFDGTATWTGSVVLGPNDRWYLFYTGSRFLDAESHANIETVGVATSSDLHAWSKQDGPVLAADGPWYERLGDGSWPEEAWRDPWVFADPAGDGWHMLVTARANRGPDSDRGVVGHAVSHDLSSWRPAPPLSEPGAGFEHLEVLQPIETAEGWSVLFSCDTSMLAGSRKVSGETGGVWIAPAAGPAGPFFPEDARLILDERLYSGRIITDRAGRQVLLAFVNQDDDGRFVGTISDPLPVEDLLPPRPEPPKPRRAAMDEVGS